MNLTIPDAEFFIQEIDAVDNAACTWIKLMSGLNFDVFQGFQSEWEVTDFFLTKQYHQNVSVVAGMCYHNFILLSCIVDLCSKPFHLFSVRLL